MLRAFRAFAQFRGGRPRAWLFAIVRNCCRTAQSGRSGAVSLVVNESGLSSEAAAELSNDADPAPGPEEELLRKAEVGPRPRGDRGDSRTVSRDRRAARPRGPVLCRDRRSDRRAHRHRHVAACRAAAGCWPRNCCRRRKSRQTRNRGVSSDAPPATDQELLLGGLVDGELDAANTALAEAHVARCEGCREELERLQAVRSLLGGEGVRHAGAGRSSRAHSRAARARRTSRQQQSPGAGWLAPGAVGAIAAALAMVAMRRPDAAAVRRSTSSSSRATCARSSPAI